MLTLNGNEEEKVNALIVCEIVWLLQGYVYINGFVLCMYQGLK